MKSVTITPPSLDASHPEPLCTRKRSKGDEWPPLLGDPGGGGVESKMQSEEVTMTGKGRSFRDAVQGSAMMEGTEPWCEDVDVSVPDVTAIGMVDGVVVDCPEVVRTDEQIRGYRAPWMGSVIIKVLGRSVGYEYLRRRLVFLWKPKGGLKLVNLENGFFNARFFCKEDRDFAFFGGHWLVFGHYLVVRQWVPEFDPDILLMPVTTVWIRVPKLPMEYYNADCLSAIGNIIGNMKKLDYCTTNSERGNFARICVEVDLGKSLVSRFRMRGRLYHVVYEGLHLVCFACGCYGHKKDDCPGRMNVLDSSVTDRSEEMTTRPGRDAPVRVGINGLEAAGSSDDVTTSTRSPSTNILVESTATEDPYGPWMIVYNQPRRGRPHLQRGSSDAAAKYGSDKHNFEKTGGPTRGSRFGVLAEEADGKCERKEFLAGEKYGTTRGVAVVAGTEDGFGSGTGLKCPREVPKNVGGNKNGNQES